jgi:RsiW-degrading membrane proteinase PrsW (M82 family)
MVTNCPACGQAPGSRWFCRNCGAALSQDEPAPVKPKHRRRWAKIGIGFVTLLLALIIAASLEFNPAALGISIVAAAAPALFYSWLTLRLDRYEQEPRRVLIGAFAWGAIGAVVLAIILEVITGSALIFAIGDGAATIVSAVIAAPVIEESAKGVALLILTRRFGDEFDDLLDGLIYGALIGLGFAMTENILYFGGEYLDHGARGLGQLFIARVVINGFGHAVYTATTGAAIGWAREHPERTIARRVAPVIGWSLAVLQHLLWNGSLFVIGGMLGKHVTLFKVLLIQAPLFAIPPVIVIVIVARFAARRELRVLNEELRGEVDDGALTREEFAILTDDKLRKRQAAWSRRAGRAQAQRQRRFFQTAAELAFQKRRLARSGRPAAVGAPSADAYRAELAALRMAMIDAGK